MPENEPQVNPEEIDPTDVAANPDAYWAPQPVKNGNAWGLAALATASVVVLGGAAFVMLGISNRPCMGQTRSARLKWEVRDREIRQAVEQENAAQQNRATTSAPSDGSHDRSR
jgi:hypothetical protein